MTKSYYIDVTQASVGRVSRTGDAKGLFTDKLNTCFGVVIIGKEKVSLIHYDTSINIDSVVMDTTGNSDMTLEQIS